VAVEPSRIGEAFLSPRPSAPTVLRAMLTSKGAPITETSPDGATAAPAETKSK